MDNILLDTTNNTRYKIINESGQVLAIEPSKLLADMFINKLPESQKANCRIIPITEDSKEILFG